MDDNNLEQSHQPNIHIQTTQPVKQPGSQPKQPSSQPKQPSSQPTNSEKYNQYSDVPWYRKSTTNSILIVLNIFLPIPGILFACIVLMTGDIYYDKYDEQGKLVKWGAANKIVAIVLLILYVGAVLFQLSKMR